MKKIYLLLILLISSLCLGCGSCSKSKIHNHELNNGKCECGYIEITDNQNKIVNTALECFKSSLPQIVEDLKILSAFEKIKIKNTQLIYLYDDNDLYKISERFKDVEMIVEFSIYLNLKTNPDYYTQAMMGDFYSHVIFFKDGSYELQPRNIFKLYTTYTFSYDFSKIIKYAINFENKFNQELDIKINDKKAE